MYILVACETSGEVRRAFANRGHTVMSVDLLPADDGCPHITTHGAGTMGHIVGDVREYLQRGVFDMVIAFPPCTHLASSGARWFKEKIADGRQKEGVDFFFDCVMAQAPKVCVENPVGVMSTIHRKPDQIIQPWQFGHGETKATCLWLTGLPKLEPTHIVEGREQRVWRMPPGPNRWKERSKTYSGIAQAMAAQWG